MRGPFDGFAERGPVADPCEVCRLGPRECVCDECRVCDEIGRLACYAPLRGGGHGMELTRAQRESREMAAERGDAPSTTPVA